MAMEMTSGEIFEHLRFLNSENREAYSHLRQILSLADLIPCYRLDTPHRLNFPFPLPFITRPPHHPTPSFSPENFFFSVFLKKLLTYVIKRV